MARRTMAPKASLLPAMTESLTLLAVSWAFVASVERSGVGVIIPQSKVQANIIFASACISTATVWLRCGNWDALNQPGFGSVGVKDKCLRFSKTRCIVQRENGDHDGLVMGSVLMPIILSSSSCISSLSYREAGLVESSDESHIRNIRAIDSYALVTVLAGFSFALSSFVYTALQMLVLSRYKRFVRKFAMSFSIEIATAVLALCATSLFLVFHMLSSANEKYLTIVQASPFICTAFATCLAQAASLVWYVNPLFRIGTKAETMPVPQSSLSEDEALHENDMSRIAHTATSGHHQSTLHLNKVFTVGEWIAVSSILTTGCVDFCFRYLSFFDTEFRPMPPYLAVSHSGFVGCLFGCAMSSLLNWQKLSLRIKGSCVKRRDGLFVCSSKFIIVAVSTVGFVEKALNWSCVYHKQMCPQLGNTAMSAAGERLVPSSLRWLRGFLSTPDPVRSLSWSWLYDFRGQQRWVWLVYWSLALAALSPVSMLFAMKLKEMEGSPEIKRKCTVTARKFFHFVAVILFLPVTYSSPSMMSLSYAVASALLVLAETLRVTMAPMHYPGEDSRSKQDCSKAKKWRINLSVNGFYEAFFDEKDADGKSGGFVITHAALVFGCALPMWISEILYQTWHLSQDYKGDSHLDDIGEKSSLFRLLPVVGVVVLGVGDAAGALVGVFCGRTKWPGSRRTVEGSFGMLISMLLFVAVACFHNSLFEIQSTTEVVSLLVALTILEAATSQIDNICLPLAGTAIILTDVLWNYSINQHWQN